MRILHVSNKALQMQKTKEIIGKIDVHSQLPQRVSTIESRRQFTLGIAANTHTPAQR